jgi:hypothetical protein
LREQFDPVAVDLIGHQKPLSLHLGSVCVVFPPGAAQRSSTVSPGFGSSASTELIALESWMK